MAASQGNDKDFKLDHRGCVNILYAAAAGFCTCFTPFLRKNFGSEALGFPGLIAFVIILLVGSVGQIPEMPYFLGIWLVAMVYQRASTMQGLGQGAIRHSRYDGDVDTKVFKSRAFVKQVLEPAVCGTFAFFFEYIGLSHDFALFFGWGAFALAAVAMIDRQLDNKRLQAMRDAALEQQYLAARYRGEIE